ncbi:MAG: hypothetical protein H7146_08645 [Burkholderiaceae bacterium]|nr:hypothetical protein [Microbacteriaceae bacterium]
MVVSLFRRRKDHAEIPRLRTRVSRADNDNVNRVALGELTPDLKSYLGRAAYLQLTIFQAASLGVSGAPHLRGMHAMTWVAQRSLEKYAGLVDEIARAGHDPVLTMEPFRHDILEFQRTTRGADWFENLVSVYVTAGLLDDFFVRLAGGLSEERGKRVAALLSPDAGRSHIVDELLAAIGENPRLASRLALWGRRLVGDTLLVARSALAVPEDTAPDEARLEPVFTELIAAHARRMDALGLTA